MKKFLRLSWDRILGSKTKNRMNSLLWLFPTINIKAKASTNSGWVKSRVSMPKLKIRLRELRFFRNLKHSNNLSKDRIWMRNKRAIRSSSKATVTKNSYSLNKTTLTRQSDDRSSTTSAISTTPKTSICSNEQRKIQKALFIWKTWCPSTRCESWHDQPTKSSGRSRARASQRSQQIARW